MLLYILFIVLRKRSNLNDTMKKVIDRNAIFSSMILLLTFFLFTGLLSSCSHDDEDGQGQDYTPLQSCRIMGYMNERNIDITESDTTNTDRLSTVMAYRTADDKQSLTLKVRLITSKDSTVDLHLYVPDFMDTYTATDNHLYRPQKYRYYIEVNYSGIKTPVTYVSSKVGFPADLRFSTIALISYYTNSANSSAHIRKYRYNIKGRFDGMLVNKNNEQDKLRIGLFVDLDTPITVI